MTHEEILKLVAGCCPWYLDEGELSYVCAMCGASVDASEHLIADVEAPKAHKDDCPWRLAKEAL